MKLLLSLLFPLLSVALHAQEAYILKNDGEKIIIDAGEYSYDTGKKIKYYSGNAIFPKTIKTSEVTEIVDGESVYKVYALDEQKKQYHLYKVVAKRPGKMLLVRFIEPPANASSGSLGAEYYITDATLAVLASGEISTISNSKRAEQEKQSIRHILEHFGRCPVVIQSVGKGVTIHPDGTEKHFDDNIALGFKAQKGILHCN